VSFGFAGFAFALFANAALALAVSPAVAVPAVMLLADAMSLTLLWEHRHDLSLRLLRETPGFARWSPVLLVAGVVMGTALLASVPASVGRLALAVVVLVFVALHARPERRGGGERRAAPAAVEATTFAGGLVDGWVGTGGIVVALHLAWRRLPPGRFVVAILSYFFASDAVRAVSYAVAGYWSRPTFALWLAAAPFAVAGYVAGVLLRRRFDSPTVFRAVVLALLALYGLALVVTALAPERA
jgi:uncharacterized membrane protein YfcA